MEFSAVPFSQARETTTLQMPEHDPLPGALDETPQDSGAFPRTLAPAWHTAVLIAGIVALSIVGAMRPVAVTDSSKRLMTYAATAAMELALLGWVALGLRLKRIPFRSLLGAVPGDFRSIAQDSGIAFVFWFGSLMVLATLGVLWTGIEAAVTHQGAAIRAGKPLQPSPSEQKTLRTLEQLAPSSGEEIAGWVMLCLLAGFVEELVFRGYLQGQFIAWAQGKIAVGVVFSALLFGVAHGYQGVRNMVLLAVFGLLFSLLALFRRSLRPCIFAHSWHDLVAGLALGLLRSHHIL